MENAHKKANKMQPKIAQLSKIGFCLWRKSFVCRQIHCTFFLLLFPLQLCLYACMCVYIVDFVSVFVWFPLFVCKKILRILSAFEIIAFAECVQRVHILASHGNENLAIRRPISLIHIFGLSSCGLLFMNNALISKMIFKWKIGKILQYCCCCC